MSVKFCKGMQRKSVIRNVKKIHRYSNQRLEICVELLVKIVIFTGGAINTITDKFLNTFNRSSKNIKCR